MRRRKRSPKRSIDCRMRGTSAMSMPVPTIIFPRATAAGRHFSGEVFERTGRASNGIETSQYRFDVATSPNDASQSGGQRSILLWKHRAQIQQYAAFLDASDNGRIGSPQPRGQFVSAKAFDRDGQNSRGQGGRWRGDRKSTRL